jgi:hypothetical protein
MTNIGGTALILVLSIFCLYLLIEVIARLLDSDSLHHPLQAGECLEREWSLPYFKISQDTCQRPILPAYLIIVHAIPPFLVAFCKFTKRVKFHMVCFTTLTTQILDLLSGWDNYSLKGEAFDKNFIISWQSCSA